MGDDGQLRLEDLDLSRLTVDWAPLQGAWLISSVAFASALDGLGDQRTVAVGALGPLELLGRAAEAGCWGAVCSSHELRLARSAGFPVQRLVATGAVKDDGFLKDALGAGIGCLQPADEDERHNVERIARALGHAVPPADGAPALAPSGAFAAVGGLCAQALRAAPDLSIDAEWCGERGDVWPLVPGDAAPGTLQGLSGSDAAGPVDAVIHGAVRRGDWVVVPSGRAAAPDGAATTHPPLPRVLVSGNLWRPLTPRPPAQADGE